MGYERIYLLGCDNNRIRDYQKPNSDFSPPALDIRKNIGDTDIWINGIEAEFRGCLLTFEQYKYYQNIINGTSTSIINLSVDSWLEMFPFDRLENIIRS